MSEGETRPPASFGDRRYHWLRSERATGLCMSEWVCGRWYSAGEGNPITPAEMWRWGWEWHSAAIVPSESDPPQKHTVWIKLRRGKNGVYPEPWPVNPLRPLGSDVIACVRVEMEEGEFDE